MSSFASRLQQGSIAFDQKKNSAHPTLVRFRGSIARPAHAFTNASPNTSWHTAHGNSMWLTVSRILFVMSVLQCMSFPRYKERPGGPFTVSTSRVTALNSIDLISDRNHDAVIRIGLAPGWWVHTFFRHGSYGRGRNATTPDLHGRIRGHPDPTDEFRSSRFAISSRATAGTRTNQVVNLDAEWGRSSS